MDFDGQSVVLELLLATAVELAPVPVQVSVSVRELDEELVIPEVPIESIVMVGGMDEVLMAIVLVMELTESILLYPLVVSNQNLLALYALPLVQAPRDLVALALQCLDLAPGYLALALHALVLDRVYHAPGRLGRAYQLKNVWMMNYRLLSVVNKCVLLSWRSEHETRNSKLWMMKKVNLKMKLLVYANPLPIMHVPPPAVRRGSVRKPEKKWKLLNANLWMTSKNCDGNVSAYKPIKLLKKNEKLRSISNDFFSNVLRILKPILTVLVKMAYLALALHALVPDRVYHAQGRLSLNSKP
jgi:hypothetical protein